MQVQQSPGYRQGFGMALKKPNSEVTDYLCRLFKDNTKRAEKFADTFKKVEKEQANNPHYDIELAIGHGNRDGDSIEYLSAHVKDKKTQNVVDARGYAYPSDSAIKDIFDYSSKSATRKAKNKASIEQKAAEEAKNTKTVHSILNELKTRFNG